MFKRELDYFIAHQDELVRQHGGKVLVLKGESVLGAYNTPLEAYFEGIKTCGLGNFAIQPCYPGPEAYTVTISPSIVF